MPELPEVETSRRRGIEPHLVGATILHAVCAQRSAALAGFRGDLSPERRNPVLSVQSPRQIPASGAAGRLGNHRPSGDVGEPAHPALKSCRLISTTTLTWS